MDTAALHQEDHRWISRIATDLELTDVAIADNSVVDPNNQVKTGVLIGDSMGGDWC